MSKQRQPSGRTAAAFFYLEILDLIAIFAVETIAKMKMNILLMIAGAVLFIAGLAMTFFNREPEKVVPFRSESVISQNRKQEPRTASVAPEPQKTEAPAPEASTEVRTQASTEASTESKPEPASTADDPKKKGNDFEGFVADVLASGGIRLKQWNQGSTSPGGVYAENELNPDFLVEHPSDKRTLTYWVECKWRAQIPKTGFTLEDYQIDRYKGIQRNSKRKIVIVLGVAGKPANPSQFYAIPLDSIARFKRIPQKYLNHYRVENPSRNFAPHMLDWFFNDVFKK